MAPTSNTDSTPDISAVLSQMLQGGNSQSPMAGILSDAMTRLKTTPFQPTPQGGGGIDPSAHPALAKVIQALSQGAGAYGWTAMPPQERLERTQLEQQKAETMARLAQAGVGMEQTNLWRGEQAETARNRAEAYSRNVASQEEARKTKAQIDQHRVDVQADMVKVREAIGQGRIKLGYDTLDQRASQFEQLYKIRAGQLGVEQAKVELMDQANEIKRGFLAVAQGTLSQRGTVEGAQLAQKLQTLQLEHPILSQIIGLDDVAGAVSESRGAQIPGVSPSNTPLVPAATAPIPAAPTPQKPRPNAPAPKKPTFRYDQQGNRIP